MHKVFTIVVHDVFFGKRMTHNFLTLLILALQGPLVFSFVVVVSLCVSGSALLARQALSQTRKRPTHVPRLCHHASSSNLRCYEYLRMSLLNHPGQVIKNVSSSAVRSFKLLRRESRFIKLHSSGSP